MRRPRRQIIVLMWLGKHHSQRVLAGALEYVQNDPGIEISLIGWEKPKDKRPGVEAINRADGIITTLEAHEVQGLLPALQPPVVAAPLLEPYPDTVSVTVEPDQLAATAVDHFRRAYLRHVAFHSSIRRRPDDPIPRAFARAAEQAGLQVAPPCLPTPGPNPTPTPGPGHDSDRDWLAALPKPVGIWCDKDGSGVGLTEAAEALDLAIPDHVAVLGTGNNPFRCLQRRPLLSSITLPGEQMGRRAAELLLRLMDHRPAASVTLPPLGIAQRGSTDVVAIDDPVVARAARYLREHAAEPITIAGMVDTLGLTRRSFQRRFKRATGRTPIEELIRLRVQLAKHRLAQTDAPMFNIAIDCGFGDQAALSNHFRRHAGMSPTAYRAAIRGDGDPANTADTADTAGHHPPGHG